MNVVSRLPNSARDKDKLTDSDLIEKHQPGYARRDGPLLYKHVLAS